MSADITQRKRDGAGDTGRLHLVALLAQALLAYTLDFERESDVSLPLSANFLRVLDGTELDVRELLFVAGVSTEATSMALTFLTKACYVILDAPTKLVRITPKGCEAQEAARLLHADLEHAWEARFGRDALRRLRAAVEAILDQCSGLSAGLQPHRDGWRATKRYVEQTNADIADPTGRLPNYPMVLHRGGWPDGS